VETPKDLLNKFLRSKNQTITYIDYDQKKDYTLTSQTLAKTIIHCANFLHKTLGLKKGDTVSYLFENCPEIIILNLACFFTGLRTCPLDSKRDTEDVATQKLKETKTKVLFFRKGGKIEELAKKTNQGLPNIKTFSIQNFEDFEIQIGKNENQEIINFFDPNSISLILYTSGTTGFPKGALLSFSSLYHGAKQVSHWFQITSDEKFYLVLPLHHINSTIFALSTLFSGGSLIIPSRYSKSRFFTDAAKYSTTASSIVSTINLDLLEEEENYNKVKDGLKFKRIQIGSAPVSPKHASEFVKKYGIRLIQGYGSTETSLRATGIPVDAPDKLYNYLLSKNSIGEELSQNKVFIVNQNNSVIKTANTEGEICIKGKNIMQGYLDRPDDSAKALKNGYFHSGDSGFFEEIDGKRFYFLKGRIKEIIIKGGINISPLFIEEKLRMHATWAKDVYVIGFPHYRFGEEIGAVFVPKDEKYNSDFTKTLQELKENKIPNLSPYETPKSAVIAFDGEIPKTSTGKIQRVNIKKDFEKKLLDSYRTIGQNQNYIFKIIWPDEQNLIEKSTQIHNSVFPKSLSVTPETLEHRATNGFVIGAFDKTNNLTGVLTGFFSSEQPLFEKNNWAEITGNGKFTTANSKGKIAILVSAASSNSQGKLENISMTSNKPQIDEKTIQEYINTQKDFIVKFHFAPKAGFKDGAKTTRIILNGNPQDLESLGTIIIFEYPLLTPSTNPTFTSNKIGIGLVEAAIKYAKDQKKEKVFALSRLGEAYKYIK